MFLRQTVIAFAAALSIAVAPAEGGAQKELPPEVRFDILRLQLEHAAREARHKDVLAITSEMRGLGEPVPADAVLKEAQAFHAVGALPNAKDSLTAYLKLVGRDGAHYDEAIRLYVEIDETLDARAREARAHARLREAWSAAHDAWQDDRKATALWKKHTVVFGGPGEDSGTALAHGPAGALVVAGAFHLTKDKDGNDVNLTLP